MRDLLRRRCPWGRKRAALLAHLPTTTSPDNLPESGQKLAYKANREGGEDQFPDPRVRKTIEGAVARIDPYAQLLGEGELSITRSAKAPDGQPFARLQSVPGLGQILALVLLSESQAMARFPRVQAFVSSCRVGKGAKEANGNRLGTSGNKIGTGPLRWACAEATVLFRRHHHPRKASFANRERKHAKAKARTGLAHQRGRAVSYRLTRE